MAGQGQEVKTLFNQLKAEWDKTDDSKNIPRLEEIIEKIKVAFLSEDFLPMKGKHPNLGALAHHREVLEIAALTAVLKRDKKAFQCAMSQLKHYYREIEKLNDEKTESPIKYLMLGLNLMYLLAENKLPEFHMELESIPAHVANNDVYISTAVKLEQYLMEGTYNKIFRSKASVPSPYYTYFIEILLDTVRDEIASCIVKAYDHLNVNEAARILFFDGASATQDVLKYAQKQEWTVSRDKSGFAFESKKDRKVEERIIDTDRVVANHIFYAKQLEMIV